MTRNIVTLFLVLSVMILLFTYIKKEDAKQSYITQKEELLVFEKEAKELGVLTQKYKNKRAIQRLVSSLIKIKAPAKDFKKSDVRVLEFDSLDLQTLNRLIKKIQNSTLDIRKLDIVRESESVAKIKVEFKK